MVKLPMIGSPSTYSQRVLMALVRTLLICECWYMCIPFQMFQNCYAKKFDVVDSSINNP